MTEMTFTSASSNPITTPMPPKVPSECSFSFLYVAGSRYAECGSPSERTMPEMAPSISFDGSTSSTYSVSMNRIVAKKRVSCVTFASLRPSRYTSPAVTMTSAVMTDNAAPKIHLIIRPIKT